MAVEEQLPLFLEENTLLNAAIQDFLNLEFRRCKERLQKYQRLYPWGKNVGLEITMAEFWIEKLGDSHWQCIDGAEAERRIEIWLKFEDLFGYPWPEKSFEENFRLHYFGRLAKDLDESGGGAAAKLGNGTCTGLVYLRAGRLDDAIASLHRLIAIEPENARAYGYLGDAYVGMNDLLKGRIFYQMAFALGPEKLDLKHLGDKEVKDQLRSLEGDERVYGDPLGWFPAIARIEGLFEPLRFTRPNELMNWIRRYQRLRDMYVQERECGLKSRLFYHAMVLSDNVSRRGEIERAEVRQKMRELHPPLFTAYMEKIREEENEA